MGGAGSKGFIPPPSPTGRFFQTPSLPHWTFLKNKRGGVKMDPHHMHISFQKRPMGYIFHPPLLFFEVENPPKYVFRVKNSPFLGYLVNFGPYITFFPENWLRSPQRTFFWLK